MSRVVRKTLAATRDEEEASHRRLVETKLDPRVRALLDSLRQWLPRAVAWERAMNAAAPIILLESARGVSHLQPRDCITTALQNESAMRGYVATPERIEAAVAAWESAS